MLDKEKTYWGWRDIADLPEAIIFYGEMVSRGYHHHEICRMLDDYFPKIDKATCKVIRFRAYKWLKSLATDIETKIYLAKSMVRLERICANEHEKTKNILAADSQLTHLLGLANIQEKDGPEELAAKMRAFLIGAQMATDGTAAADDAKAEAEESGVSQPQTQSEVQTQAQTIEFQEPVIKSEVKPEVKVCKPETKDKPKSPKSKTLSKEQIEQNEKVAAEKSQKAKIREAKKQEREDEDAVNLFLRVSRAKRLKEYITKLEEEGIKTNGDNKDEWESEADA